MWSRILTLTVVMAGVIANCSGFVNGWTVTCYNCSSSTNSDCNDPFRSASIRKCSGAACSKETRLTQSGLSTTHRSCYTSQIYADVCADYSKGNSTGMFCLCTHSLCNTATSVRLVSRSLTDASWLITTLALPLMIHVCIHVFISSQAASPRV